MVKGFINLKLFSLFFMIVLMLKPLLWCRPKGRVSCFIKVLIIKKLMGLTVGYGQRWRMEYIIYIYVF